MSLAVLTRGNSKASGKTKVYISCGNEYRESAVASITEWIFKVRNYAIYYPDGDDTYEEKVKEEILSKMNCIIIPIFPRLMGTDYSSLVDYQIAVRNNIPAVMILMEGTDTADFYEKYQSIYGNIQMLTPYNTDNSKIPFEQVLVQYLERMTSDDAESYRKYQKEGYFSKEINKCIQEEFRGSIFISYRKENRRLVNEMIQRLHNEKELVDIMLWYDEYLVPGENYSDSLKEQITNCDCVLLLVTPELFEEGNYVLTHEYPLACEKGKIIVAIGMDEIDKNLVSEKFPKVDYFFNWKDYNQISLFLSQLFRTLNGDQKPLEGMRAYMLGKAYMDGKLVEVNRSRGVEFIQKAAESSFVPAIQTLISYYENGNGVRISPELQLRWEKRLAAVLNEDSKGDLKPKNTHSLVDVYQKQGDIYLKSERFEEAIEAYKSMLATAEEFRKLNGENILAGSFSTYEVLACNNIANASLYIKNYTQVRKYLELSIKKYEEFYREDISLGGNVPITETWILMGRLESAEGEPQRAINCYKRALQYIGKGMNIHFLSMANEVKRSEIYELMGWEYVDLHEMQQALKEFEQALKIAVSVDAEYNNLNTKLTAMRAYYAIASLYKTCNQYKSAIGYYEKAILYAEQVAELDRTLSSYRSIFRNTVEMAFCLYSSKMYHEAYEHLKKAESLLEEKGISVADAEDVMLSYNLLGNIAYIQNKPAAARKHYRQLLNYSNAVYEKNHDVKSMADLGAAYYKLSTAHSYVTDWISIENAYRIYKFLSQESPNDFKLVELFRKVEKMRVEKYAGARENRQKVSGWASQMLRIAYGMEEGGLRNSNDTSLSSRIVVDILEMVIMLVAGKIDKMDEVFHIIVQCLENELSYDDFLRYVQIKSILLDKNSNLTVLGIPQSIEYLVTIMKSIGVPVGDYHEIYPYSIRIVMWSIGEWILEVIDAGRELREEFIEYFDQIDFFVESELMDR